MCTTEGAGWACLTTVRIYPPWPQKSSACLLREHMASGDPSVPAVLVNLTLLTALLTRGVSLAALINAATLYSWGNPSAIAKWGE